MPLIPFGQGFKDMSPALDLLEADLLNSLLEHGGNPVLTSCMANARTTRDPAGNRKLDKSLLTQRIDGAVALAMARGVAGTKTTEDPGPLFVRL
jgi:phage terminase large subunit-like protein